jgi:hypothetical protein
MNDLPARLRQLSKEMTEGDPKTAGMLILAAKAIESSARPEARESIIQECRTACLEIGQQAHEAAKAKDAYDYVAGYQDCAVDIDDALRDLLQPHPEMEDENEN